MQYKYNIDQILDMTEEEFSKVWDSIDPKEIEKYQNMYSYDDKDENFFEFDFEINFNGDDGPMYKNRENLVKILIAQHNLRRDGRFEYYFPNVGGSFSAYELVYASNDLKFDYVHIHTGYDWRVCTEKNNQKIINNKNLLFLPDDRDTTLQHPLLKNSKRKENPGLLFAVTSIGQALCYVQDLVDIGYCGCFGLASLYDTNYLAEEKVLELFYDCESG